MEGRGFPGGSEGKESACNVGDLGSIHGLRRSPGEGNGNPLQYSCLENPIDRGAWQITVHGVTKSQTWLSDSHFHFHKLKEWAILMIPASLGLGEHSEQYVDQVERENPEEQLQMHGIKEQVAKGVLEQLGEAGG